MKTLIAFTTLILMCACGSSPEGTTSGDCSDNKDNDKNGFVDCEDKGCELDDHCIALAAKAKLAEESVKEDQNAAAQKKKEQEEKLPYLIMENIWVQKTTNGEDISQIDGIKYCDSLVYAGKDDWRLPTQEEALAASQSGKLPQESAVMWTSTMKNKKRAIIVGISTGAINDLGVRLSGQCRARCVRDKE